MSLTSHGPATEPADGKQPRRTLLLVGEVAVAEKCLLALGQQVDF
jgi:hypothetical protein